MKQLFFMVGIPGSGKSTYIKNELGTLGDSLDDKVFVYSTDDLLMKMAEEKGISYQEAFDKHYKSVKRNLDKALEQLIKSGEDKFVIWDQTNVVKSSRAKKLSIFSDDWNKICFYVKGDVEECIKRVASRKGNPLTEGTVRNIHSLLEEPSLDEGFDRIIIVE